MLTNVKKPINYTNKGSRDYLKISALCYDPIIIDGDGFQFKAYISAKSFRNLKKEDKRKIKRIIHSQIDKIDSIRINKVYDQKIAVKLILFLPRRYLKKVDVDNVAKTVLDVMNKKAYVDDRNIIHMEATKINVNGRGAISVCISKFERFGSRISK